MNARLLLYNDILSSIRAPAGGADVTARGGPSVGTGVLGGQLLMKDLSQASRFLATPPVPRVVDHFGEALAASRARNERLGARGFSGIQDALAALHAVTPGLLPVMRRHQRRALAANQAHFADASRGVLQMFCGTGKTAVAIWELERRREEVSSVLAPTIRLVKQWRAEYARYAPGSDARLLVVCSERDVDSGEDPGAEDIADLRSEGLTVTTAPDDVRSFLAGPGRKVVFSTYQSSPVLGDALRATGMQVGLGVFDEAHVTASGERTSVFSHALDDRNVPMRRRLFMTATPKHYRQKPGDGELGVAYSMDNPAVYGPTFFTYSGREAIDDKVIVDYQVLATVVESQSVDVAPLRTLQGSAGEGLSDETLRRLGACAQALGHAMTARGIRKVISFHRDIKHARAFSEIARRLPIPALQAVEHLHVNGYQGRDERDRALERLAEAGGALMTNAAYLGVGIDIPDVDAVFFVDPKQGIDVIQAAGRAVRRNDRRIPRKERGYILVPLFVDLARGETVEEARRSGAFADLMEVAQSFAEADPLMAALRRRDGRSKLGSSVPFDFVFPEGHSPEWIEGIRTATVEELAGPPGFAERLDAYDRALADYRRLPGNEHARFISQHAEDPDHRRLAQWMTQVLVDWRKHEASEPVPRLTAERVAQLQRHFGVSVPSELDSFLANARDYRAALERYRKTPGNADADRLPNKVADPDLRRHATWAANAIADWRRHEAGKKTPLTPERIALLQATFGVEAPSQLDPFEAYVAEYPAALARFRALPGNENAARISMKAKDPELRRLGQWLTAVLVDWRRFDAGEPTKGRMNVVRIAKLKAALGVASPSELDGPDAKFEVQLAAYRAGLARYRESSGDRGAWRIPPTIADPALRKLALWMTHQLTDWRTYEARGKPNGRMTPERIAKLRLLTGTETAPDRIK